MLSTAKSKEIVNYLWITLGSFLFCAGLSLFIVPVGLYNGGSVGVAQIIRTLTSGYFDFPPNFDIAGILNLFINIPLLILAYTQFRHDLAVKTVFSVITQTLFFSLIPVPLKPILTERTAACIIGGLLSGVGVGFTLRAGGSGGGNDVLGLWLTQKIKGFTVGKTAMIVNAGVYLACAFLFDLSTAIYSIIYAAVYSVAVDKVHLQNINIKAEIITRNETLYKKIMDRLHRGSTFWKGTGGYTNNDMYIIVTVISKYEVTALKQLLAEEDPDAFVIFGEGPKILGNFIKRL